LILLPYVGTRHLVCEVCTDEHLQVGPTLRLGKLEFHLNSGQAELTPMLA